MKKPVLVTLSIILFFLIGEIVSANDPLKIRRVSGKIQFDGIPTEVEWKSVNQFPLTMYRPESGTSPSELSEVRIGYDDEYLWIGASLTMHDPSKIFEATKKRDERLFGMDAFGIILDSFNDKENGLAFFTTPTGIMTDYAISNDAVANGPAGMTTIMNYNWNTFWDVKTSRDNNGWYVEMRIPFSGLKFKPAGDIATMGLTIIRNISSNTETDTYPAIKPEFGFLSPFKPSLCQEIIIAGAKPKRPLYIAPYILGGFSRDYVLDESETEYIKHDKPEYTAGLDLKYNINSNLTLDLTANTDFAQVESDMLQVNMTRYSLFYPEKRKFFQERTSLFDFSLGGLNDNLFYSRNIGIANGTSTKIYGGARLTGRMGKWDLGFLEMQTAENDSSAGENFGVLRMRRQVINKNSYVGGIITSRIGMNGHQNLAYGVDGIFKVYGNDYVNIKWSQTYDSDSANKMSSLAPSFFLFDWERRSEKGFAYKLDYSYSGEKFKPGSGFIMRGNVHGLSGRVLYGWLPGNDSKLFSYNVSLDAHQFTRCDDGKLESMMISPMLNAVTKSGFYSSLAYQYQKEGVREDFSLSDSISVKAREYSFSSVIMMLGTPSSKRVSIMENITAGQFYDGRNTGIMSNIVFKLSSSFNLTAMYSFNAIRFPSRHENNKLNIHTLNMTAMVMFSTKLSASLMTQFESSTNDLINNFRIRYNPKEGNDLYLVYNDFRRIADKVSVPQNPGFFNKTFMVKYVHTFTL